MPTAELERGATDVVAFTIQPIDFATTKAEIEKVTSGALMLRVADVNDKAGLEKCHKTRMQLRAMRTTIEAKRKSMKADALEYGRKVDSAAKELMAPIEEAEAHLVEQENIVAREKERLAKEVEEKRQAMLRERFNLLSECSFPGGSSYLEGDIARYTPAEFTAVLESERKLKAAFDERMKAEKAERERIAEQQRIEAERLAREKAELERQRREQAEAQAKIDAENRRIELEKAKVEAAEKARLAAIAEQQRREAEAKTRAEADERERQRIEALRPDREKLLAVAVAVGCIDVPVLSADAQKAAGKVIDLLQTCEAGIRRTAEKMMTEKVENRVDNANESGKLTG